MIIYEPRGKAREYSDLAVNLYTGCVHKCKYCYCPAILRKGLEDWGNDPHPRKDILRNLEKDCKKHFGEKKQLLLSFMSDPYQTEEAAEITRKALLLFEKYKFKNVTILSKGGERTEKDFDILKRNGWKYGATIIFDNDEDRKEWEPYSASIESRIKALEKAHKEGIYTWISMEPVIYPEQSYRLMESLKTIVDYWKVGKINHFKDIEDRIDWNDFYRMSKSLLDEKKVYWKKDLLKYA